MLLSPATAGFSWWNWELHPSIVLGVLLLEGLYLYWAGTQRSRLDGQRPVTLRQAGFFTLGVVILFLALASPIHDLADHYLFSAHMVQHMVLLWVVPPLLLWGTTDWLLRPFVATPLVLKAARLLAHPILTLAVFNGVILLWHLPVAFNTSLEHHNLHIFQHLTFLAAGVLLWWPVLSPLREVPRPSHGGQLLYLFAQSLLPAIVGGIITFAEDVVYDFYQVAPRVWDISPALDQQVGGLIMKTAGLIVFVIAMAAVFFSWAAQEEEAQARRQRGKIQRH